MNNWYLASTNSDFLCFHVALMLTRITVRSVKGEVICKVFFLYTQSSQLCRVQAGVVTPALLVRREAVPRSPPHSSLWLFCAKWGDHIHGCLSRQVSKGSQENTEAEGTPRLPWRLGVCFCKTQKPSSKFCCVSTGAWPNRGGWGRGTAPPVYWALPVYRGLC